MIEEKISPFIYANSIMLNGDRRVIEDEFSYNAWLTNKALSQHLDCVVQANNMNCYPNLPKRMQFDYLFRTVKKRRRPFNKWGKSEKDKAVGAVQQFFYVNRIKAEEMVRCMTDDEAKTIVESVEKNLSDGYFRTIEP